MITLYKGDDTGGQLGKNVKIVFHCDDAVDMDDVVVKFDLLGIVKREFTDVHDGDILDIFISHAESRKFPLGVIFAKMWGEDASGKLRTFANRIPFRVTLNLIAVYGSDGTDSQDIHVYSSVDWDSIANKPTVFPSSVEEVEGLQEELDDINGKIPEDASSENQLADKDWVDQEIDRVAAYYITSDAQGNPFQTRAALLNAETYYSGGSPRTPTRNDYAIVLADETHDNTEWRYIYSVNEQGVGTWEAQYPVEGAIVADDNVTKTSTNPVKSSGIWSALWGMLAAIPSGFSSMYDWVVAQLGQKRNYTDLSYNTQVTVNAPALHAILTSRGTQLLEYYLPCTEDIPATPEINHVYTWRRDGAEFYITQGVSALTTIWTLYNSSEEQLARITTDNSTQGYFPDLTFETSAYAAVTSTKVNSYPDEVQETLALDSNVPTASTSLPRMDSPNAAVIGTPGKYACSDHVHPSDTSRVPTSRTVNGKALTDNVTLTGADIPLSPTPGASDMHNVVNALTTQISNHENNTSIHVTATEKATWNGKQNALSAQQLANIAAVSDALAFDATHTYAAGDPVVYNGTLYTFTSAHTGAWTGSDVSEVDIIARLAGKLDTSGGTVTGNLTLYEPQHGANIYFPGTAKAKLYFGSGLFEVNDETGRVTINSKDAATIDNIPYTLVAKTATNGAVALDDRASNAVTISATLSPNTLTVNFPTAPTGKLRDFAMRLNIAAGVIAPEIAWPQGVTLENNDGEVPEIADGGTGGSSTILYFSETENNGTTAKFLVKSETLTAITQA